MKKSDILKNFMGKEIKYKGSNYIIRYKQGILKDDINKKDNNESEKLNVRDRVGKVKDTVKDTVRKEKAKNHYYRIVVEKKEDGGKEVYSYTLKEVDDYTIKDRDYREEVRNIVDNIKESIDEYNKLPNMSGIIDEELYNKLG